MSAGARPWMAAALVLLALAAPAPARAADTEECEDAPVLPRLSGCTIRECTVREFDEAELQTGPVGGTGDFPKAFVEGALSVVTYVCPATLRRETIARLAQATLRRAGYTFVYTGHMLHSDLPGFTARRGPAWVQLVTEAFPPRTGYTVTYVRPDGTTPPARPRPSRR